MRKANLPEPTPLLYVGTGFLAGTPARDLSLDDVTALATTLDLSPADLTARLVASGLYAPPPLSTPPQE